MIQRALRKPQRITLREWLRSVGARRLDGMVGGCRLYRLGLPLLTAAGKALLPPQTNYVNELGIRSEELSERLHVVPIPDIGFGK